MLYLAAELSLKVILKCLTQPLKKVVVYLDPEEFITTWLGNKASTRTVWQLMWRRINCLAPVKEFGEDKGIDS